MTNSSAHTWNRRKTIQCILAGIGLLPTYYIRELYGILQQWFL